MKVVIRAEGAKGSEIVSEDEAAILYVADRRIEEVPYHVHTLEIGGVEIHCQGFTAKVVTGDVFLTLTVHNITEDSWGRFMEHHPDEWFDGSGLVTFDVDTGKKGVDWFPGADLVVGISSFKVEVLDPKEA